MPLNIAERSQLQLRSEPADAYRHAPVYFCVDDHHHGPFRRDDRASGWDAIHGNVNLLASLSAMGLMGMVLTGDWKRRKLSGRFVIMAVIAVAMILAWAGCGGGGGSSSTTPPAGGGTPSGSYPLQVSATGTAGANGGNTSAHPLNITLVVQ